MDVSNKSTQIAHNPHTYHSVIPVWLLARVVGLIHPVLHRRSIVLGLGRRHRLERHSTVHATATAAAVASGRGGQWWGSHMRTLRRALVISLGCGVVTTSKGGHSEGRGWRWTNQKRSVRPKCPWGVVVVYTNSANGNSEGWRPLLNRGRTWICKCTAGGGEGEEVFLAVDWRVNVEIENSLA